MAMERHADQSPPCELAPVNPGWVLLFLPLLVHLWHVLQWNAGLRGLWAEETDEATAPSDLGQRLDLTVVLPVRNEADTLPRLLSDLAAQTLQPVEVIVIDDASEDDTVAAAKAAGPFPFPLRLIDNPGRGKKPGLSAGIRAANTEWAVGIDADARIGPDALWAISNVLCRRGEAMDMALLPLRIARTAKGPPEAGLTRLQSLDFAAMQGWAVAAVRRGQPAMASGGGWVWRCDAFPHNGLRPDIPSGDDVFSLSTLIERGDAARVGWIDDRRAMVSAGPMDTVGALLDQRIRWGAKSTRYPQSLRQARQVAWTVAAVHATGLALLVMVPVSGLLFWGVKSAADMAYTARVGRMYGLLPQSPMAALSSLFLLAVTHPVFVATTLLVMPLRTGRWKGRPAV